MAKRLSPSKASDLARPPFVASYHVMAGYLQAVSAIAQVAPCRTPLMDCDEARGPVALRCRPKDGPRPPAWSPHTWELGP